jgi:hypothetical protein
MKVYFKLFAVLLFISMISGCETTNPDGPDTSDDRDPLIGSWIFAESASSRGVNSTYTVVVKKDPSNSSQVLLSNFGNSGGDEPYGIVTSGTPMKITIPSQTIPSQWIVVGVGTLATSSKMNWTYSITAGGDKTDYIATATLQ